LNYYPFHLGDYAAHTGHLEPMEDLVYRRLLDLYYLRECPLPADIQATAKLIRCRSMAADVEAVLREFFVLTDDGWRNPRCDEEIAKMQDKQAKARKSAAASVNARRANAERSLPSEPTGVERSLPESQTNVELPTPTPTPTPIPKEEKESRSQATRPPSRPKSESITLTAYLANCKAAGQKPVPDGHAIRRWCADAGIVPEMLQIAWVLFRDRYTEGEKGKLKRYKDWPGHFATAVKDNWAGLWFMGDNGKPAWTSKGLTHKAVLDARLGQKEAAHG